MTTPIRQKIINAATSQLGVKYHKDARVPNVAFDCVQFIGWCYEQGLGQPVRFPLQGPCLGFKDNRIIDYIQSVGGQEISLEEALPADVIIWCYRDSPHHTGMIYPSQDSHQHWAVHSCAKYGKVAAHPLGNEWAEGRRFHSVWRLLDT